MHFSNIPYQELTEKPPDERIKIFLSFVNDMYQFALLEQGARYVDGEGDRERERERARTSPRDIDFINKTELLLHTNLISPHFHINQTEILKLSSVW